MMPHRTFFCLAWALAVGAAPLGAAQAPLVKLDAVPFTDVRVSGCFWAPRQETNRTATIPANFENLEAAGNLENLRLAARKASSGFKGPVFMDSDVYKALEAASYCLAAHPDPALEKQLDEIVAVLAAAQQPDGYLNSYFTVKEPAKRWTNLRDWHELYCAGHMFEAAVAHYQATGKSTFLRIATRFADCIDAVFGPPPKRMGYPGHPEIELALIKLWRATGNSRYFELARFFVENRGRGFFAEEHRDKGGRRDLSYWQDDVPIREHRNIKGHAVRAAYLMSGATDVAAVAEDAGLLRMLNRVWRNTSEKNLFLTGGIGPSAHNEGFTVDYDLPNLTAYQETCATIALAQWSHRMALLYGDGRFADVVERALYNGVLSGVSLDGRRFFYVNPLESRGGHHRSPWFSCACCPPNVARTLAALGGYAYATSDRGLWVNLYLQGSVRADLGGRRVTLNVTTEYPWDGRVVLQPALDGAAEFQLRLRLPGWCVGAGVAVNGQRVANPTVERGYAVLARTWRNGDTVELNLPMPVQRIAAHPRVKADHGLLAIQRGPIVYCIEACDQPAPLASLFLPADAELRAEKANDLLGGVVLIKGEARLAPELDWNRKLYQPAGLARRVPLTAIPYYAWDNRQPGEMKVWLSVCPPAPASGGPEARAQVSVSFAHTNSQPPGIRDGVEPQSSGEQPAALCHWWPHKGGEEWAQYTWRKPVTIGGARVYWFDDTGRGGCRLPAGWHIAFLDGERWQPVKAAGEYPIAKDRWCQINFQPVTTTALRLIVTQPKDWSCGVHEWRLLEAEDEDD